MQSNPNSLNYISTTVKRLNVILSFILALALAMLVVGIAATFTGCGTNAPTKAAQGEQILITTVNKAVKEIVKAINAGQLTQHQCDQFATCYKDYYAAQMVAKAAIEKANVANAAASAADIALAQSAVDNAEKALLAFVNSVI